MIVISCQEYARLATALLQAHLHIAPEPNGQVPTAAQTLTDLDRALDLLDRVLSRRVP